MREIKFRAWDRESGRLILFSFKDIDCGELPIVTDPDCIGSIDYLSLSDTPIMQFTGVLDSKGTEIYEGDVVSNAGQYNGEVQFIDGHFTFSKKYINDPLSFYGCLEVIGNIYENPELIKDTK